MENYLEKAKLRLACAMGLSFHAEGKAMYAWFKDRDIEALDSGVTLPQNLIRCGIG
jgi:hypothetical protein